MPEKDHMLYIEDILTGIERINEYTDGSSYESFAKDYKTIDAIVRNFEIIGEAANKVPSPFTVLHPEIPWDKMTDMRNKMIHEYSGVDTSILWQTIKEDIPKLREQIKNLLPSIFA